MSDGTTPTWSRSLRRYVLGPGLAVVGMILLILNYAGIDPRHWKDADSSSFQTTPEGDDWEPFTASRLRFFQETREPVLVHVVASWSPAAAESRVSLCTRSDFRELFARHPVRKLLADVSGTSRDAQAFLRSLGVDETPTVALFLPDHAEPNIRVGPADLTWLKEYLASIPPPPPVSSSP
ncbi:hypothetical protein K2X85_20730 [bacterium]|nr:hypothetical protein [bacterium]